MRAMKWVAMAVVLLLLGCGPKRPETVRLMGVLFNYSQETVINVRLNGVNVGMSADKAKVGGVTSGGGVCCFPLELGAEWIDAEVELWDGRKYTVRAEVEPWPDLMSNALIHVLPGQKVVVEITPGSSWSRRDLIAGQIKALGLRQEVPFSDLMNDERPQYTGYYKKGR